MNWIFLFFVLTINALQAQVNDAEAILKKSKEKYTQIKDYQADVSIKVDIDFIKIPVKTAHLYFKYPDKVKFETSGFIMMHKKAMNFSIDNFIKGDRTAIYVKQDKIDNSPVHVIKILPNDENSDMILTTLWIDATKFIVRKVEHHSKTTGSFVMSMIYKSNPYDLPEQMILQFDAGKNPMPIPFDEPDNKDKNKQKSKKKASKGSVIITYRNFKVNQGIKDEIFVEKKK